MTNYEKIKAMSVEEMAKSIEKTVSYNLCCYCIGNGKDCPNHCKGKEEFGIILEWLLKDNETLPEICSCGYRFETDETICPNCGKKVEEDG